MFKYWIKLIFSMNVPLLILNVRYIVIIARNIFKQRRVTSVYNRPKNENFKTGNEESANGNANGELGTGNGERGTGNGESLKRGIFKIGNL